MNRIVKLGIALLILPCLEGGVLPASSAEVVRSLSSPMIALPPANDTCAGAIELYMCSNGTYDGETRTAGNDYDPGAGCTGRPAPGNDVVFSFEMHTGWFIWLSYTREDGDASAYVVTDCAAVDSTCLMGVDRTGHGQAEVFEFSAPRHAMYYLILDANEAGGGNYSLEYNYFCFDFPSSCCFPDGSCRTLWWDECIDLGGTPVDIDCSVAECAPTPVEPTTWGRIKSTYRTN